MPENLDLSAILGSATGGGLVVILAKLYLQRAFEDLDKVAAAMQKVQEDLGLIAYRLEKFESYAEMLREHDKKLAVLERMGCPYRKEETVKERKSYGTI